MNTLETIGNAQLMAIEGRQQIALAVAAWLKPLLRRAVAALTHRTPASRPAR
jgi:hypothetical protein